MRPARSAALRAPIVGGPISCRNAQRGGRERWSSASSFCAVLGNEALSCRMRSGLQDLGFRLSAVLVAIQSDFFVFCNLIICYHAWGWLLL